MNPSDKLKISISFMALLLSIISLVLHFTKESQTRSPNIQIVSCVADRNYSKKMSDEVETFDDYQLSGEITLKNYGNSSIFISKISYEPYVINRQQKIINMFFAISDVLTPSEVDYFISRKEHPILGIQSTKIEKNETKIYHFKSSCKINLHQMEEIPNIIVTFYFNNGQKLDVIPEIIHSGVGLE